MLFNLSTAWAQSPDIREAAEGQTVIKPLQIGDTIPEELWNLPLQVVNHPEGKDTITLNDYRDKKLIVLDFWATWCGSCIDGMRQYLKNADRYDEYATILYTTTEGSEKIDRFLTGQTDEISNIASIVNVAVLKRYFPHRYLPHLVWLTPDGTICGFTQKNALNTDNLKLAYLTGSLSGGKIDVDIERPLFLMDGIEEDSLLSYRVLRKGKFEGLPVGSITRRDNDGVYGVAVYNRKLTDILSTLFSLSGISNFDLQQIKLRSSEQHLLHTVFSLEYQNRSKRSNIYKSAIRYLMEELQISIIDQELMSKLAN